MVTWQMYGTGVDVIAGLLDLLVNYVSIMLAIGIGLQVIGAILVFLGIRPKLGAILLIIYLSFSTVIFYPFWFYEGTQLSLNFVLFLKNLAILGGLLMILQSRSSSPRQYEMMDDEM